jgi:GntR family transcriptional regulator
MIVIDPTGPIPPYRQLARILRRRVTDGTLPIGTRITEADVTDEFEVARNTARRALAILRDEGLIFTVPHRGSYVGPRPSDDE